MENSPQILVYITENKDGVISGDPLMLLITDGSLSSTDANKYINFLELNAQTMWLQGTARPQIIFNTSWTSTATKTDLTTQLSGAMLIEAAAKLKELDLID